MTDSLATTDLRNARLEAAAITEELLKLARRVEALSQRGAVAVLDDRAVEPVLHATSTLQELAAGFSNIRDDLQYAESASR